MKKEGNARYECKVLNGQQQLTPGTTPSCPFFITVYGIRDEWKVTKMCIAHDHYRHVGFQGDSFVEGDLATSGLRQHNRDMSFATIRGIVEREMLPAYSDDWASVKGKAILEFLLSKNIESNRQTASRIKRQLTDVLQGNMEESYQKLESYLSVVATENPGSHYGFEKHSNGVFKRACFFRVPV
ncbi:hypothetical protein GN958_ATG20619 [Phytophthora infestans]|uniref:Uncharacterized protein n=1 Tax=Phytophthora infestans TaxID=4787 RepID=A0A8S9TUJ9_PHYIN|nr:hypothetical protein GN958_ATG20619 [Phytophthora infestans]